MQFQGLHSKRLIEAHFSQADGHLLGGHAFTLEGRTGERIIRPYSLRMLQRARDCYQAIVDAQREPVETLLRDVGGDGFMQFEDSPRLLRDGLGIRLA